MSTVEERFWAKVDKSGDCWLWTAAKYGSGYGAFNAGVGCGTRAAHRVAWEWANGAVPPRKFLDHICHNRACVNPSHLRVVSNKENGENRAAPACGMRGVAWKEDRKKWRARVMHNYMEHFGGYYDTAEEAAEAAKALRLSLFTHNELDRSEP